MRFELYPSTLGKIISLDRDKVQRTITFETPLESPFEQSTLKDGRLISSLSCATNIRPSLDESMSGSLTFIPAYAMKDLNIKLPDSLDLEISIPQSVFDSLWNAPHEARQFLVGGQIEGIPSKYRFGPTLEPHEWDIEPEDNRSKPLSGFSFGTFERPAEPNETKQAMHVARATEDELPRKYGVVLLSSSKYPENSQMRRVCRSAIEQAQREAERRRLTGWSAESLLVETLDLVESAESGMRVYDAERSHDGELWTHKDIFNLYHLGRNGLEGCAVDRYQLATVACQLIQKDWLRLDELEWSIVDALIFDEIFEFGESVKSTFGIFTDTWAFWLFRGRLTAQVDQRKTRTHCVELLSVMRDGYALLKRNPAMSPVQIRAGLLRAQEKGAIWDSAAFALLDRATVRTPPVWIPL